MSLAVSSAVAMRGANLKVILILPLDGPRGGPPGPRRFSVSFLDILARQNMRQARLSGQLNLVALKPLPNRFLNVNAEAIQAELFGRSVHHRLGFGGEPYRHGDFTCLATTDFRWLGIARH